MDIQRLRNLTTGQLHTRSEHMFEDIATITGEIALPPHMLPRALMAIRPWLQQHFPDARYWDGKLDLTHTGEVELPATTDDEHEQMLIRYVLGTEE